MKDGVIVSSEGSQKATVENWETISMSETISQVIDVVPPTMTEEKQTVPNEFEGSNSKVNTMADDSDKEHSESDYETASEDEWEVFSMPEGTSDVSEEEPTLSEEEQKISDVAPSTMTE